MSDQFSHLLLLVLIGKSKAEMKIKAKFASGSLTVANRFLKWKQNNMTLALGYSNSIWGGTDFIFFISSFAMM